MTKTHNKNVHRRPTVWRAQTTHFWRAQTNPEPVCAAIKAFTKRLVLAENRMQQLKSIHMATTTALDKMASQPWTASTSSILERGYNVGMHAVGYNLCRTHCWPKHICKQAQCLWSDMFCALDSALEEALSEEKASKATNFYQFQVAIDVSVFKLLSRPSIKLVQYSWRFF